jgi:hypothetical protein
MLDKTTMKFSHVKPGDTDFKGEGLRDFLFYRDLGIAEATAGKVLAQLVRSNNAPKKAPVGTITVPTSTSSTC